MRAPPEYLRLISTSGFSSDFAQASASASCGKRPRNRPEALDDPPGNRNPAPLARDQPEDEDLRRSRGIGDSAPRRPGRAAARRRHGDAARRAADADDRLGRQLQDFYQSLVRQPVPDRFVALIDALEAQDAG
jgi:Anti-sigma factor NepR